MKIDIDRDFGLISKYHRMTVDPQFEQIDDNTWEDLDMDDVFSNLDRNVTPIGQQYLYRILRYQEHDHSTLMGHSKQCENLNNDYSLREKIHHILQRLKSQDAYYIVHLLFDPLPRAPWYRWLIYLSSAMMLLSTGMMFFLDYFFFLFIFLMVTNVVIHSWFELVMSEHFTGLIQFNIMLGIALSLAALENQYDLSQLQQLSKNKSKIKVLRRKIGWLVVDRFRVDQLQGAFIEYLNYFCLFDMIIAFRAIKPLTRYRNDCVAIFESVASLDAMNSITSWRSSLLTWCKPESITRGKFEAQNIYHPLTSNSVPNSIALDNSLLITGSNMSGKTTFLKTIGLNIVLGRALNTCLATNCQIPDVMVKTSIWRNENLEDGNSYYFAEVRRLGEFIKQAEDRNYIFLIDEIYRGTNTVERIASAAAVLKYLANKAQVVVTTHDIELQDILETRYRMCHFTESIEEDQLKFEYCLKDGPTTSRNAIRLLMLSGYPEAVTEDASSLAEKISKKYVRGE